MTNDGAHLTALPGERNDLCTACLSDRWSASIVLAAIIIMTMTTATILRISQVCKNRLGKASLLGLWS